MGRGTLFSSKDAHHQSPTLVETPAAQLKSLQPPLKPKPKTSDPKIKTRILARKTPKPQILNLTSPTRGSFRPGRLPLGRPREGGGELSGVSGFRGLGVYGFGGLGVGG